MSIVTAIQRLQTTKNNIRNAIISNGGSVPSYTLREPSNLEVSNQVYIYFNERVSQGDIITIKLNDYSQYRFGLHFRINLDKSNATDRIYDSGWKTSDLTYTVPSNYNNLYCNIVIGKRDGSNISVAEAEAVLLEFSSNLNTIVNYDKYISNTPNKNNSIRLIKASSFVETTLSSSTVSESDYKECGSSSALRGVIYLDVYDKEFNATLEVAANSPIKYSFGVTKYRPQKDTNLSSVLWSNWKTSGQTFSLDSTYGAGDLGDNQQSDIVYLYLAATYNSGNGIPTFQEFIDNCTFSLTTKVPLATYTEDEIFTQSTLPNNYYAYDDTLIGVILPSNITRLGDYAFRNCYNLRFINLDHITSLNTTGTFMFCKNLHIDVNMPNLQQQEWVLLRTFAYSGITSISNLGNITETAGDWTDRASFYFCKNLKSVKLPETLTTIRGHAFSGCKNLTTINFPTSITYIGADSFNNTSIDNDELYLPNLINIYTRAFTNTKIKSITSLGSITMLGDADWSDRAIFGGCTELTSVVLPETLTQLRDYAFRDCTSLKTINIPQACTTIGGSVFNNCTSLDSLDLSYVKNIYGHNTFAYTKITTLNLQRLELLTGHSQFKNMKYLTTVTISGPVTELTNQGANLANEGSFCYCDSLTTVTLSNTITTLGSGSFYNDTQLTNINLNNVQIIKNSAFENCSNLNINVSTDLLNVTTLEKNCFYNCNLTGDLHLPNLTSIGENSFYRNKFTKISDLGQITTIIGGGNFSPSLYEDTVLTTLQEVVLPETLTSIGSDTFRNNRGLTTVTCLATTPPTLGGTVFYQCNSLAHIYVPAASVSAYQATTGWIQYASIIQAIP